MYSLFLLSSKNENHFRTTILLMICLRILFKKLSRLFKMYIPTYIRFNIPSHQVARSIYNNEPPKAINALRSLDIVTSRYHTLKQTKLVRQK